MQTICKVGSKRGLIEELRQRIPTNFNNYYEPFVDGGALFFTLQPPQATLSDVNMRLILAYDAVKNDVDNLIKLLKIHKKNHSSEYFQEIRSLLSSKENVKLAAAMINLNKTCFNGLYKVNKSGKFNVPLGKYTNPAILDEENLLACHQVLQTTKLKIANFEEIKPTKGDFVYLKPPYDNTYSQYDGLGFDGDKHKRLADYCKKLDKRGGKFMLSNSDTSLIRKFKIQTKS